MGLYTKRERALGNLNPAAIDTVSKAPIAPIPRSMTLLQHRSNFSPDATRRLLLCFAIKNLRLVHLPDGELIEASLRPWLLICICHSKKLTHGNRASYSERSNPGLSWRAGHEGYLKKHSYRYSHLDWILLLVIVRSSTHRHHH